jgi:hypothetical protein
MTTSAENCPTSTEGAYNDFINGTCDKVQVIKTCKGTELWLDTYEDSAWLYMNQTIKPPSRDDHMMAAVYGTDKIVLYGGRDSVSARLNDTWVYDLSDNTWIQKFPTDDPGPRDASSMAAIWGTDKVLMFGGAGLCANDSWIYDLSENNWTRKYPVNHPNSMEHHTMSSIYCTDKVLLFGGIYINGGIYSDDTWIYDLSDNYWTQMKTNTAPDARAKYGMSFIYHTDKVILFGGGFKSGPSYLNDTWLYDLSNNTWTNALVTNPPSPVCGNSMAAIYGTDKVVMFSGATFTGFQNKTWIYDLSENTWTERFPKNPPTWRAHSRMDSVFGTNKVIMFGGHMPWNNETWEFKLNNYYYEGNYVSPPYYIDKNISLRSLSWNGSVSTNTSIKFQLRTANTELELNSKAFVGFDGTSGTYYSISPSATWQGNYNQSWFQYKAYLSTTNYNETPILRNVSFVYNYWPNTILVDPNNGSILGNNRPTFKWNFTDRDSISQEGYQVLIDDDSEFDSINYDSGEQYGNVSTWQFPSGTTYSELSDGTWFWKARTKDNDGDWGLYSEPWKMTVDTIAPSSMIKYPGNNDYYNKMDNINGIANDSIYGTGLNSVEISIHRMDDNSYFDGISWSSSETWLPVVGTHNWAYNSNAISWYSGWEYNIRSRAIDIVFNVEIPNTGRTFIYDAEPVTFTKPIPSVSKIHNTSKVEVGITISDEHSGVNASTIEYSVSYDNGTSWEPWSSVIGYEKEKIINIKLNLTFPNGTGNRIRWCAADLAGNGPTESEVFPININNWIPNVISRPEIRLWSPPKGTNLETDSVNLSWILVNPELKNVKYELYFDMANPPMKKLEGNFDDTYLEIDNLSNGKTYYWTVIPKIGELNGTCISGIWSFTVDIPLPKVTLITPANNSVVTSIKPTFVWKVEYSGSEDLSYRVHLDTSPNLNYNQEVTTTYYMPQLGLVDNFTYYWRVVPYVVGLEGYGSEVWTFTVREIDIEKPKFEIDLALNPDELEIKPDQILFIEAIVTNLGDLTDNFTVFAETELGFYSKLDVEIYRNTTLEISPGKSKIFLIMVSVKENSVPGLENVIITTESELDARYGLNVEDNELLIINIIEKDKDMDQEGVFSTYYFPILLIIIILLILVIIILIIVRKRTLKEKEKEEYVDENEQLGSHEPDLEKSQIEQQKDQEE